MTCRQHEHLAYAQIRLRVTQSARRPCPRRRTNPTRTPGDTSMTARPDPLPREIRSRIAMAEHDARDADNLDLAAARPETVALTLQRVQGSLKDLIRILRDLYPDAD